MAAAAAALTLGGQYSLGLDVGTQGTKAILYDLGTNVVAGRGAHCYELLPRASPATAEQHPSAWLEGIRVSVAQALAEAGATPDDLAGVSVSGQQHGMVALDADGEVVRPAKLWCDTQSAAEAQELGAVFGWQALAPLHFSPQPETPVCGVVTKNHPTHPTKGAPGRGLS